MQQSHQAGGDGAEVGAAFGGAQQQLLAGRSHLGEAIGGTMLARGALVRDQGLDMLGLLDLRALVVAAAMAGQHMGAIDDADLMRVGQHRQHPRAHGYAARNSRSGRSGHRASCRP